MTKAEFENIAHYEVTNDDYYKIIEPMYMATDIDKFEFVAMINPRRFALKTKQQLLKEMGKLSSSLKDTCTHYTDTQTLFALGELMAEYKSRFDKDAYLVDAEYFTCYYPFAIRSHGQIITL